MDPNVNEQLKPGTRVKVTQQIPARNHTYTTDVIGTVLEYQQKPTGSWFAHSRGDKLWLDRLLIRKDDGELTTLILDDYTVLEVQQPPTPSAEAESVGKQS